MDKSGANTYCQGREIILSGGAINSPQLVDVVTIER
jgi:hypothetical protein